jgi:hypothetical protein
MRLGETTLDEIKEQLERMEKNQKNQKLGAGSITFFTFSFSLLAFATSQNESNPGLSFISFILSFVCMGMGWILLFYRPRTK